MSEFEMLVSEHRGAVERYVRYNIPSKADSDDVLQEVWLAAYRQFDRLKNKSSFKDWVIGIARHKVKDYFRSRQETIDIDDLPESELVQSRYGLVEYSPVHETIDRLSDNDKQILILYYFENMPQNEIADRLGIPLGTVKSRLNTARRNFKNAYPYPPKGADIMFKLPKIIPEYKIIPSDKEPFTVRWEELMGWFIVPKVGEKLTFAIYDQPSRKGDYFYEMEVIGKAEIHGIEGIEIISKEGNFDKTQPCTERRFVAQLTDTHCRYLAESHVVNGVRKLYTFLDGEDFLPNWGYGEDNCGNEINLSPKGIIVKNGSDITVNVDKAPLDIVGRYTIEINGKSYDTVCVIDVGTYNDGILSEQFIDKNGRTILWRRFNRNDWALDRYGKLWTETLPDNERLMVNGEVYVHWYDCVSEYIF
ncbi:RNA polymerase sigma factor [Ruminococcus albus]|uniref:Sigma-70 region 2 n=1 Tax=Ruminococcus albus 8 TaxID=246199 RepID=E9SBH5_RUMAL|nr:sigma-70 family RNA polymerase sigma factor [Ruminococcus albus]EGC03332.1 Sigma-70 region 2 [Ruminococcus albus 8]MCC3351589.1 sigma-70 family RNA polymerase sigma factor [Ruminococcus albus 8]